ncbi:MAG: protein kinase domain-containing protein [Microcoleus sp.]
MYLQSRCMLHDRYEIIDTLGEGGFGRTYTAMDSHIPERPLFVVKEIRFPESNDPRVLEIARRRFEREASALRRLGSNSRIPELFDRFEENDCFYLVQEYIQGHRLSQEITPDRQWTEREVVDFLREVLEILEFVHGEGIVHRDIKPANLMRRESDEQIVLIDFGAVKEIATLATNSTGEILTSEAIGTIGYMPIEQCDPRSVPHPCNDIYAVGIIAIQALTGRNPNVLRPDCETAELIWHYSTPDRPAIQISDDLKAILNRMVRFNFRDRYQSAADVLQDLNSICESLSPPPGNIAEQSPNNASISPQSSQKAGKRFDKMRFILLGIGVITGGAIALLLHSILTPKTCPLVFGDALSCGEESLLETSTPRIKQGGVKNFTQSNYREAFNSFKRSWQEEERRDPETLIYMNNALLRAQKVDYDTIAVIVPVRKNEEGRVDIDLAQEILRGVAQAQTEVNLKLFNSEIDRNLNGLEFQENRVVKGRGLQVIIANDANQKTEAIARANSLVKLGGVLGAIGHYTNEMTVSTVDIYDRNKLVLISPGSTTEELTENRRNFFFRTVPRTKVSVEVLTKYLMEKQGQNTVSGFYNTKSEATSSTWEEFRKQFRERGGKIAKITEFDLSQSDFNVKKALQEVRQTPSEKTTIFVSPGHQETALNNAVALFKANLDQNWFVGTGGIYGQKTLEATAQLPSFDKMLVSVSWHHLNSPNRQFLENTRQLWEGNVSHRTALTYDAAKTLIKAIEEQQQPSREGMQKTIANSNFSAEGATGKIEFERGDRKNFQPKLVHIVKCSKEQFGVTFVPIEFPTAAAAGLKCE